MAHSHENLVPPGALRAAAALIALTVLLAALSRQGLIGEDVVQPSPPVAERDLMFLDRETGGILVVDARSGKALQRLAPGSNGFLRGVLRGLARDRRLGGFDPAKPFRLTRHVDGRLSLTDLATARRIELISFGPTNAAVFARFLTAQESSS